MKNEFFKFFLKEYKQDFKFKIIATLFFLLFSLFLFSFFRVLLYFAYYEVFSMLSLKDIIFSFVYGFRFDLSMISIFLGFFIFILFIPINSKKYIRICFLCLLFFVTIIALILCGDFFYFAEAKRHMTDELAIAWQEKEFIIKLSFQYYWWILLLITVLFCFVAKISFNVIDKKFKPKPVSLLKNIIVMLLLIVLVVMGIREKFSGRPINMAEVYKVTKNNTQATLMLNGIFTSYQTLRKKNISAVNSYPKEQALKNIQKMLEAKDIYFPDDDYPIMRQFTNSGESKKYNFFIVLLESWMTEYIDSYGGNNYGVTPNFDMISKEGVKFNDAYAIGVRSIFGLSATLSGVISMPGMQFFSNGLEINNMASIAEAFDRKGYYTMYAQSSLRKSLKMSDIAKNIFHFKESYGKEDIPILMDYPDDVYFGYDYDLLDFASKKAAEAHEKDENFFIYTFTGTTHMPFIQTLKQFEKYSPDTYENRYLNNLYYSDYAIGHLLNMAKEKGYFENTIFIFIADHTTGGLKTSKKFGGKFKIPFLIYAPGVFEAREIDYTVSQLDILPTIYFLAGIDEPFTAIGNNVFDAASEHFALINEGMNIILLENGNYMMHNRKNVQISSFEDKDADYAEMENNLLSLDKAVISSFMNNKWFKPIINNFNEEKVDNGTD
jgi:Phosphoglycerol transferase and related proteins, alkaline phosphatase superfamily